MVYLSQTERISPLSPPEAQTCFESNRVSGGGGGGGGGEPPYDHWERKGPSGLVTAIYLHTALLLSDQSSEHPWIAFNGAREGGGRYFA